MVIWDELLSSRLRMSSLLEASRFLLELSFEMMDAQERTFVGWRLLDRETVVAICR